MPYYQIGNAGVCEGQRPDARGWRVRPSHEKHQQQLHSGSGGPLPTAVLVYEKVPTFSSVHTATNRTME